MIIVKALYCVSKEQLAWRAYEPGEVGDGQVRVAIERGAAKHGTEMSFYTGYHFEHGRYDSETQLCEPPLADAERYPVAMGNMQVGRVTEAGAEVSDLHEGDRVCFYSGFCESAVVTADACYKMPPSMSWKSAVCLDPLDFALGAVRDGHVRIGDAVAVFGMGAIGLMVVQCARLAGAHPLIALEPLATRREVARELGADLVLDPTQVDAGREIRQATAGRGADIVIDYSGAMPALQAALRGVAYGGTVVLGAYPRPYSAGLDLGAEAHYNVPDVVFSRACSQPDRDYPRWDNDRIYGTGWRLLCEGRLTGEPIVRPVVEYANLIEAYGRIPSDPDTYLKLGVRLQADS